MNTIELICVVINIACTGYVVGVMLEQVVRTRRR
jgi:hypothetical protein